MSDEREPAERKPTPVGDAIRAAIKARGWSGYKAARVAGVSPDTVQRFMNEGGGLNLATVEALVVALGVVVTVPGLDAETAGLG